MTVLLLHCLACGGLLIIGFGVLFEFLLLFFICLSIIIQVKYMIKSRLEISYDGYHWWLENPSKRQLLEFQYAFTSRYLVILYLKEKQSRKIQRMILAYDSLPNHQFRRLRSVLTCIGIKT